MTTTTAPSRSARLSPARLSPADTVRVSLTGMRTHPMRAALATLGICLGIGAMVAVLGVSTSSRADLDRQLDRLGTNLLTVQAGQTVTGDKATLPMESPQMVTRIPPVYSIAATGLVDASVYRNDHIDPGETGSIAVLAVQPSVLTTVGGGVGRGDWLNPATSTVPTVVLGAAAAGRLAIDRPGVRVWLGGQWFGVAGILAPIPLAAELDNAALVGWDTARQYLGFDGHPTTLYCRSVESQVESVRSVLAATVNPASPNEVRISRPSDALAARRAANRTLDAMLLGLGAVALVVGGVGVANTMVISVLERRGEIGLRRALGATRGQIRLQFLMESLLLAGMGGVGGVILGVLATDGYAATQHWPAVIPWTAWLGGVLVALPVGAVAGLYPAIRAARLPPVSALTSG